MTSSAPSSRKLSAAELQSRLDQALFASPSYREAGAAPRLGVALADLARPAQEQALRWIAVAAEASSELAYQIALAAPAALTRLDADGFEDWVLAALETCDLQGPAAAQANLGRLARADAQQQRSAVRYAAVETRLTRFIQGLSGRALRLAPAASAWTDSETLYLPEEIDRGAHDAANHRLYKALASMLWAQTRFGGFGAADIDLRAGLAPWLGTAQEASALGWLAALESVRLEACIAAELPGLAAEIALCRGPWPALLQPVLERLSAPAATLADSLALLPECLAGAAPPPLPHAPRIDPEAALAARAARIARDMQVVRRAVAALLASQGAAESEAESGGRRLEATSLGGELCLDGDSVDLPQQARAALASLLQDLGELPPECLQPAGPGAWQPQAVLAGEEAVAAAAAGRADQRYDEWDYRRQAYRRDWCQLFESDCGDGDAAYVDGVLSRHRGLVSQLRRRFEMLRGEDRLLGRQNEGDEIDIDAAVEAVVDRRCAREPSPRLFRRRVRNQRSLAAMFMVDMSGSTKGWVNDAEREALVLLCEALETLGDAYAIYGFSGMTRNRCEIYRIKRFADGYDAAVRARIAAVSARDYTRMGVAVRHLTRKLLAQPARHRLLLTLSDGRPDDYGDEYRGHYGVEDTRRALQEAQRQGVRSYCVTIDRHGADYLAHMYGAARYTVLDDVSKLPLKIADIYRHLVS